MSEQETEPGTFENQMQALAEEAAKKKPEQSRDASKSEWFVRVAQLMKPVALGIESLTRTTTEQTQQLQKLTQSVNDHTSRLQLVEEMREEFSKYAEVAASNQRLFDAMHEELRGYKDSFLFDAMQKPFIKDVLVVFDDLQTTLTQCRDLQAALTEENHSRLPEIQTISDNLENNIHLLVEVLTRMDVAQMEAPGETLDKRTHRVVGFQDAPAEEDGKISHSVRTGFIWRDRVIRPEEVIIKRGRPVEN